MRVRWLAGFVLVVACAARQASEPIALSPKAENVEIAIESPSLGSHTLVGPVEAVAEGRDPDSAVGNAKILLRNKAADLGATLVTIDKTSAEPVMLQDMSKATLVGRAFKPVD
jgi:hypothetical protein